MRTGRHVHHPNRRASGSRRCQALQFDQIRLSPECDELRHEVRSGHLDGDAVNAVLGPLAAAILRLFGRHVPEGAAVIPDYLAMLIVITMALTLFSLNFLGDGLRDALDPQMRKG